MIEWSIVCNHGWDKNKRVSLFFRILSHICVVSMFLMRRLHLTRSCASSPDSSLSDKSFLMLSNHLRFGLPLLLFPGTSITITLLPTYSSSLLNTCPYHSCTFLDISPTFAVPLILSFLIQSSLVNPLIHPSILIDLTNEFVIQTYSIASATAFEIKQSALETVLGIQCSAFLATMHGRNE